MARALELGAQEGARGLLHGVEQLLAVRELGVALQADRPEIAHAELGDHPVAWRSSGSRSRPLRSRLMTMQDASRRASLKRPRTKAGD